MHAHCQRGHVHQLNGHDDGATPQRWDQTSTSSAGKTREDRTRLPVCTSKPQLWTGLTHTECILGDCVCAKGTKTVLMEEEKKNLSILLPPLSQSASQNQSI
ncbi:hypothetical protein PBY51_024953 [Eleginops maclovinus]|uniref:Uncharacterized protein n=1 Tax=Eleginops maclovinus TaxID=56733 RepID=A0AAN7XUR9_ELEMC|nr:hypothetical protein PBY51_024953 [Eleginops maclovinus]